MDKWTVRKVDWDLMFPTKERLKKDGDVWAENLSDELIKEITEDD